MNSKFKLFVLIFLFLFSCEKAGSSKYRICSVYIVNKKGKKIPIQIEVAQTAHQKRKGLMFRKKIPQNRGMLFVYDHEKKMSFWMKNTYIPLSIAYISSSGTINELLDMKPLDTSIIYSSREAAQYALEVNKGWFKKNDITPGSKIILNGCIGKQDTFLKE